MERRSAAFCLWGCYVNTGKLSWSGKSLNLFRLPVKKKLRAKLDVNAKPLGVKSGGFLAGQSFSTVEHEKITGSLSAFFPNLPIQESKFLPNLSALRVQGDLDLCKLLKSK